MSDNATPKYSLQLQAAVNGRVGRPTITVLRGDGSVWMTHKEDLASQDGMTQAAEVLAARLGVDSEELRKHLEGAWTQLLDQRRLRQAQAAEEPAPEGGSGSSVEVLLSLAECAAYSHGADGRPYATVPVGDKDDSRRETLCIRHESFRDWLRRCYYRATGRAVPAETLQAVLGVLAARANYDGPTRDVRVRVPGTVGTVDDAGKGGGTIYLALGDDQRRAVQVDADGWQLVPVAPVLFRRPRGQKPLPEPVPGGRISDLRPLLNVRDEEWPLVVAWLAQALCPRGPYPMLCLHGEQGAAKSSMAKVLKRLVDPSVPMLRTLPRNEQDLCIGASNAWVLALDNLSDLRPWLSDALCRLSTGGGLATRQLYTDEDEAIFDVQCPVILTGIEDLAARPDALDRSILLTLLEIPDPKRLTERKYLAQVEAILPGVLGALLDGISGAFRILPEVEASLTSLPRMADFAVWMEAATRALGFQPGEALAAYLANRDEAAGKALDASLLTGPLRTWLQDKQLWEGTCAQLLADVTKVAGDTAKHRDWPKTPRAMSGMLRRLAPILRTLGVVVDLDLKGGRGTSRRRVVRIYRTIPAKAPATPSPPSPPDGGDASSCKTDTFDCKEADGRKPTTVPTVPTDAGGADGGDGSTFRPSALESPEEQALGELANMPDGADGGDGVAGDLGSRPSPVPSDAGKEVFEL